MVRIVIVGNGFDLAHGLKTSYGDFIKYIIEQSIKGNKDIRDEIFDVSETPSSWLSYIYIKDNFETVTSKVNMTVTNTYFVKLLKIYFDADWVDIESFYFKELSKIEPERIHILNYEFELIKKHLEIYLGQQNLEMGFKPLEEFLDIFDGQEPKTLLLLNFNYTRTLDRYFHRINVNDKTMLYIHGELGSKDNPMIFGYGDETNPNYQKLINNENNKYLLNLKRQQYNLASPYEHLKEHLVPARPTEVFILGHSLGLTDKTLLKQILDSDNVKSINLFYHKNKEGFRNLNDNLTRLVSSKTYNDKVVSFPNSTSIPQLSERPAFNPRNIRRE